MSRNTGKYKKERSKGLSVQGETPGGYSPMRATNFNTGQLQDVILMAPGKLDRLAGSRAVAAPELGVDLSRAFSQFNRVEQRLLYSVLVEGQALEAAVKRRRKSMAFYHGWLNKVALPKLREALSDYRESGRLVIG